MADPRQNGKLELDSATRQSRVRSRNLAMSAVLGGLVLLFYVITIVKMGGGG